ncbi:hypothetical protein BUALT_Bualt17G0109100 [Buddleja alternifolia]|uniref:KIB1-4 beta-propeller domain-containing protein n=1 Tax=Buddleja alternifolia TaxID=168488 RepID=A0AAV6WG43_9LAMI|nr:hypothetical protein BUALT_Bualt17G0109100 [Buddleja alternifolia]
MVMENSSCYPPVDSDQTHPWLMVSQGSELQNHTFYSISKGQYFERSIPEFCHKQVAPTSYGWLALFDLGKPPIHCYLFSPASREKIPLPPIELDPKSKIRPLYRCILSKPPNGPDSCYVLILSNDDSILFCRLGDDKFIKTTTTSFGDDYYFSAATNFKGTIYAWIHKDDSHRRCSHCSLVEVDFVGKEIILKRLVNGKGQPGQISMPFTMVFNDYLLESSGELLLVHMICHKFSEKVKYFRIFKINTLEGGEITELRNIGDHNIFISDCVSMSRSTKSGGLMQKNSIYYAWHDKNLYAYDIENRSKTVLKPCPIEGASFLKCWVMV